MFFRIFFTIFFIRTIENTDTNESNDKILKAPYYPKPFKICFESIGCVETNEDWYNKNYRPMNMEPLDRHTIRTEFLLIKSFNFTKHELVYDSLTVKPESIQTSGYDKTYETIFLIHDFTSNGETGWIKHISVPLLKLNKFNVISIDWESGAEPPFPQAISNARVVGLEGIAFIKMLMEKFELNENKVRIIGHGVGAHIAGYIGKVVRGIKKITALDPTGPYFQKMPCKVKLTRRDAQYVEVLHTDAYNDRSEGTLEAMGHADFYINKAGFQPGCEENEDLPPFTQVSRNSLKEGKNMPGCSHKRAFKYYVESLEMTDCKFVGVRCEDLEELMQDRCTTNQENDQSQYHSFELESQAPKNLSFRNRYMLRTSDDTSFCLHSYKVMITIGEMSQKTRGSFEIMAIDYNSHFTNMSSLLESGKEDILEAGRNYTMSFYASSPKTTNIKEVKLKWTYWKSPPFSLRPRKVNVKNLVITHIDPEVKGIDNVMCPFQNSTEITNGNFIEFERCYGHDVVPDVKNVNTSQKNEISKTRGASSTESSGHSTSSTKPIESSSIEFIKFVPPKPSGTKFSRGLRSMKPTILKLSTAETSNMLSSHVGVSKSETLQQVPIEIKISPIKISKSTASQTEASHIASSHIEPSHGNTSHTNYFLNESPRDDYFPINNETTTVIGKAEIIEISLQENNESTSRITERTPDPCYKVSRTLIIERSKEDLNKPDKLKNIDKLNNLDNIEKFKNVDKSEDVDKLQNIIKHENAGQIEKVMDDNSFEAVIRKNDENILEHLRINPSVNITKFIEESKNVVAAKEQKAAAYKNRNSRS